MNIPAKILGLLTPPQRRTALGLLGLTAIGVGLEALGIGLVIPAIALLTQPNPAAQYPIIARASKSLGSPDQMRLVSFGMFTLVGIYLIKSAFLWYLAWRQMKFVYGVQAHLSQQLFATYLRQPYAFHLQRNSAQLIRNATTEVALFAGVLTDVLHLLSEGLVLLGIAALLLIVEPVGTIFVGFVLGCAAFGFHRVTRTRVTRWGLTRQAHEAFRIQHLQQGLGGVKEIKLYGRDATFLNEYRLHNEECARVTQKQQTLLLVPRLWMELLAVSGIAILVVAMLAQGHTVAAIVPALGLFAAAAFRLMPLFNRVLNGMQSLRFGLPVVNVLHDEFTMRASEPSGRGKRIRPFQNDIRLANVSYTYPLAAAPAITSLTLAIRKNECVGFVGSSGSGKSTLVDLILGLLTPTVGKVMVDGSDIHHDVRAWQDQVGYVPQTIFLTDDSLRRNVAFGVPSDEVDDAAVVRAVAAAQLDGFVAGLPLGLETSCGERGVRLSGGQRQRIGIARALYHDPAVLVLDEATSALDTATETDVMDSVAALQGSRTILIVAHRTSTVERCDRLFRLDCGSIAEELRPLSMLDGSTVQ